MVQEREKRADAAYACKGNTQILVYIRKGEQRMSGEFRHLFSDEFTEFRSISEFIFLAELMLEELGSPKASTECRRTWGRDRERKEFFGRKPKLLEVPPVGTMKKGRECFLICIQYRQNSSWQGQIRWIGRQDYSRTFRSVLELIMILEHSFHIEEGIGDCESQN